MRHSGSDSAETSAGRRTRDRIGRIGRITAVARPVALVAVAGAAAAILAAPALQGGGTGSTTKHAAGHAPARADGTADRSPAATAPRIRAYPDGHDRFHLTLEDARPCALPPGVTGPAAGGRVRLTVTTGATADGSPGVRVTGGDLTDSKIYYSGPDDIVAGFSLTGPGELARAGNVTVDVECRALDGSWSRVASTGRVAVRSSPAVPPPMLVADPLTSDSQVVLRRRAAETGTDQAAAEPAAIEATVDGRPATLAEGGARVLLPSGTGPGLHVLTLIFPDDAAKPTGAGDSAGGTLTVPIVNGYAPPSEGGGTLAPLGDGHGGGDGSSPAAGYAAGADGGPVPMTGPIVLGALSLLLIVTAGLLILIFHRRGTAA